MIATSCFVTTVNAYLKRRRSCDTDCWPLPPPAAAAVAAAADACLAGAGVTARESGERESQTVGGAEAGFSESLPGSLYSIGGHTALYGHQ